MMSKKLIVLALTLAFCLMSSAHAATIIWVSGAYDDNGDGAPDDQEWIDLLEAEGYTVDVSFSNREGDDLDDDKIAALNAADPILFGTRIAMRIGRDALPKKNLRIVYI